jgi:tetratricopeptide (TPR) repeat protein
MSDQQAQTTLNDAVNSALEMRKKLYLCLEFQKRRAKVSTSPVKNGEISEQASWDNLGRYFLTNRMYEDAIIVYQDMLEFLESFGSVHGYLHKGLPLYNIGIAQINLGDYDSGIPNVLRSLEADKRKYGDAPAEAMLANKLRVGLLARVSSTIHSSYMSGLKSNGGVSPSVTAGDLISKLSQPEGLLLCRVILSDERNTLHDNEYARLLLLENLKNLCLLTESYLSRIKGLSGTMTTVVSKVFEKQSWLPRYISSLDLTWYNSASDFSDKLSSIESLAATHVSEDDFHLKNFLYATLIRNFVAHRLDEQIPIVSNRTEYELARRRIFWALLYSLYI